MLFRDYYATTFQDVYPRWCLYITYVVGVLFHNKLCPASNFLATVLVTELTSDSLPHHVSYQESPAGVSMVVILHLRYERAMLVFSYTVHLTVSEWGLEGLEEYTVPWCRLSWGRVLWIMWRVRTQEPGKDVIPSSIIHHNATMYITCQWTVSCFLHTALTVQSLASIHSCFVSKVVHNVVIMLSWSGAVDCPPAVHNIMNTEPTVMVLHNLWPGCTHGQLWWERWLACLLYSCSFW
jgi:hypothetical protein